MSAEEIQAHAERVAESTAKKIAAEAVAETLGRMDKRRANWSTTQLIAIIGAAATICFFLAGLQSGQRAINTTLADMVTQSQLASWTFGIRDANADLLPHPLRIPDPAKFQRTVSRNDPSTPDN